MRSGAQAEQVAASWLREHGFKILAQNWKTKLCEIDIIATKADEMMFIEVKYRQSDTAGDSIEYITPSKLKQMERAAEMFLSNDEYEKFQPVLAALAVKGPSYEVAGLIEIV